LRIVGHPPHRVAGVGGSCVVARLDVAKPDSGHADSDPLKSRPRSHELVPAPAAFRGSAAMLARFSGTDRKDSDTSLTFPPRKEHHPMTARPTRDSTVRDY